ncbi:anthranilate O-methyltransferase 3-like [Panicum miliaceum]|uniref:Anthranilate O-methyltransferase 3-like n=1 Tax=Panicum miliaceum TaxID=4540 RepID=A0A3L6QEH5_PANMI|nr:anthranilate O-methyltransferase 3-like [Panicum miliaceum]
MKVERDLHMSRGDGETSYASNSRLREKSILKTRPVLHEAVAAARASASLSSAGAMVVADLGCSSGPNTLLVVSEVLGAVAAGRREAELLVTGGQQPPPPVQHVQFFLNDLPGNDFNLVFQSLELFKKLAARDKGDTLPPYYVAGLPGSFYTRLFPDRSVHLFHSSYCLMWRSKARTDLTNQQVVPEELARGTVLNEGNIYIWEATPPSVVELYRKQFQEDFSLFLKLRHKELASNGQMVLAFLGRKNQDVLRGEVSYMWGLLAQALQSLVKERRVEKEKLNSFNLPFYAPSVDEVRDVIRQSEAFDINHIHLFESNWDPHDDLDDGDLVLDSAQSGVNIAQSIRAVIEPLVAHHFGEHILDDLFEIYVRNVAAHLRKVKTKHPVIVLSLAARRAPKYQANGDCYSLFAHGQFM